MLIGPGPFRPLPPPAVVAVLAAPLVPGVAGATDAAAKEKARRWYEEGVALFREGRYAEAAERFQLAYNVDPAPNLLYNLARAHEEAGDRETAALFFQSYLDRYPEADDRAEVERRIATLRAAPEPPPADDAAPAEPPPDDAAPSEPRADSASPAEPPAAEAGAALAPADAGSRLAISVWLAAGTAGEAEYDGFEVRSPTGPGPEIGDVEEKIEKSGGLGASIEYRVLPTLALGGRLQLASYQGDDSDLETGTVALGPLVRGLLPLGADWRLQATAWGGVTAVRATADGDVGEVEYEGTGWHVGAGAGAAWSVQPGLWLTATFGATRETFELESEAIDVQFDGSVLRDAVLHIDETVLTRWYLELGVTFEL